VDVAELTMPLVEYGKDDEELLNQSMKQYHAEMSEENDGYSIIVTVPGDVLCNFRFWGKSRLTLNLCVCDFMFVENTLVI